MKAAPLAMAALAALLATACAQSPSRLAGNLERETLDDLSRPVPDPLPLPPATPVDVSPAVAPAALVGTGRFVHPPSSVLPRTVAQGAGALTFNFEDQPIEAVVRAILADVLDVNYSVMPGVGGTVSFSTARPVSRDDALPILETLLAWTGNALIYRQGRYDIVPRRDAVAGQLVPRLAAAAPRDGHAARLFPLRFVAAKEMEKLLGPFMASDALLLVDTTRNLLVMAGTPGELDNYAASIETFDVDWVAGMSVGVFPLANATTKELLPGLESVFGTDGKASGPGPVRLLPVERSNAIVVIATQPALLTRVGEWIERMDRGGGNEPRLYVHDVRNLPAGDVARHLGQIYGGYMGGARDVDWAVAPGLGATTLSDGEEGNGDDVSAGHGSDANDAGFYEPPDTVGAGGASPGIRIAAVEANNQVMVHARPSEWGAIRAAIDRLDAIPLQVQIETRILEVALQDNFRFGVQWYLEGLAGSSGSGTPTQPGNKQGWGMGRHPPKRGGADTFFYSFVNKDLQALVRAMEEDTHARTLSAPSLVVVNNRKAEIRVGDEIPVTQTFVNTQAGGNSEVGQVTYKKTGVVLRVRPRVNPGGLVYLDVKQEVSKVGEVAGASGNASIEKRTLDTEVAVQSGQTVLLGGLIREMGAHGRSGVPWLSRVPLLGRLFGNQWDNNQRTETIVLITPRVITNAEDARRVADEYRRRFRSLEPFSSQQPVRTEKNLAEEGP
ncbi:type II secretion system protein GspD [Luteibacter pinisoli]|uniref:Type II secretion system protein GspD n=1 Tax=Luteibacter pinisoli TaxID=2589080 RepID=A0A4Y5YZT4_9GAMM|nr:type II secretion system secretin GspD [Luteibacter pinisoli]QDE38096.1 type II secretion system protein GspD [Luteibacter pinisoli]